MIDYIRMTRTLILDAERFNRRFYRIENNNSDVTWFTYKYKSRGVTYSYSTLTHKLKIEGKLFSLCSVPNRVDTLGELWAGVTTSEEHQDLEDILDIVNSTIFDITSYRLDVRLFKVTYIEICFNLSTTLVDDYIKLFNRKFDSECKERYKSFVSEMNSQLHTSFYIKTKRDFEQNTKSNFVVNFYNKADQLRYLMASNEKKEYDTQVTQNDLHRAENILRLEVQCGYQYLRRLRTEYQMIRFADFLNIDTCAEIVLEKYKYFIDKSEEGQLSFHNYRNAIEIITASALNDKQKNDLQTYCLAITRGQVINQYRTYSTRKRYNDLLAGLQIHSFLILPRYNISAETLVSPMLMLNEYVNALKERRAMYVQRYGVSDREAYVEDAVQESRDTDNMDDLLRDINESMDE